jgi:dihydropteroate synthase-like protein
MDAAELAGCNLLFVTGRLAEPRLREVVERLAEQCGFRFEIAVPGVQVAALLHTGLLLKRLQVPESIDRVILPGWCQGDLRSLEEKFAKPFLRGPRDLLDLPEFFGVGKRRTVDLSRYSIEIIAEINHATHQPIAAILEEARQLGGAGADVIDVGGVPGESSPRVADIVGALRSEGFRVSIDSFDPSEVEQAIRAGAELILSCNSSNVDWVTHFETEVVAIPDMPSDSESFHELIGRLQDEGIPFRIDPIIEPIGIGFTQSLSRYIDARRRYPELPMMMGVGNVTELAEVDSAGVNFVLAALCEDLGIQSVLTTQVINWCRTAVAEFNAARRLVHYAVSNRTIPKHLDSSLVMLRSSRLHGMTSESLQRLAESLTDNNFRVFAEAGEIHLMNRAGHWRGSNVFRLFQKAMGHSASPEVLTPEHAFYLGYELARAEIALQLGKQYVQDAELSWGLAGDTRSSSMEAMHARDLLSGTSEPDPET